MRIARNAARIEAEVAVVGLGPVGSLLTALLARHGVRVVALDREKDVYPLPRAAHIDHMGLRSLQEVGVLDEMLPTMIPNPGIEFVTASRQRLLRVPGDQGSVSGVPASMYFCQPDLDRALRRAAGDSSLVQMLDGTTVEDVVADDDAGARLWARRDDGSAFEVSAQYVVGCDGASGETRSRLGIDTEDLGFEEDWAVVDVIVKEPVPSLPDHMLALCDPARPLGTGPLPGSRQRFEVMLLPGEDRDAMRDATTVQELLSDWLPPGSVEFERTAVYTFRSLIASPWRSGRVLLAGDAAHLMPPFLGQGMCSGLRDATNLAWKLGLVLRRGAPDTLLDTYELERRPHVRAITEAAVELGRLTCMLDPDQAAARDRLLLSDPALAAQRFAFHLPSLTQGPLVADGGGDLFTQPVGSASGARLDDVVGSRFLVLGREEAVIGGAARWWRERVGALVCSPSELPEFEQALDAWLDARRAGVAVIRPDRYVLSVGSDLDALTAPIAALLASVPYAAGARC